MRSELVGFALCLCQILALLSCTQQRQAPPSARPHRITSAEAINLAKKEFVRAGYRLEDYTASDPDSDSTGERWVVFFESRVKYPRPGDHYLVWVEKKGGRATLMAGE